MNAHRPSGESINIRSQSWLVHQRVARLKKHSWIASSAAYRLELLVLCSKFVNYFKKLTETTLTQQLIKGKLRTSRTPRRGSVNLSRCRTSLPFSTLIFVICSKAPRDQPMSRRYTLFGVTALVLIMLVATWLASRPDASIDQIETSRLKPVSYTHLTLPTTPYV